MILIIGKDVGSKGYFAYLHNFERDNFYLTKDGLITDWRIDSTIMTDSFVYFKSVRELLSVLKKTHTFYHTRNKKCEEEWHIQSVKITSEIKS